MINITLPDGSVKQFEKGSTVNDVAMSISHGLARNVVSAKFNETIVETVTPLNIDGNLTLFTFDSDEGKKAFWHSTAHVLAQAIVFFYPKVKLTIGPAIDNGFYYDLDL
jgi:threonyl-tRNA synthetase